MTPSTSLKIALAGYGKMGKMIEQQALAAGHTIVCIIDPAGMQDWENLNAADVLIDFTTPEAAPKNIERSFLAGVPVVCGTTGWWEQLPQIQSLANQHKGCLIYGGNFSIGMNILFKLNTELASWMNAFEAYDPWVFEKHHSGKKDGPGGSALQLGQSILKHLNRKTIFQKDNLGQRAAQPEELSISFARTGHIIGYHEVGYSGPHDQIVISHQANTREGFAKGAIWAAEKIQHMQGVTDFQSLFQKI
jgi:4-hydroxy-tetrahydrodipicolinate reductase